MSVPIKTYKKVLNFLEAGFGAGFTSETLVNGVDSTALGQTSNIDADVPTGSRVKVILVQFAITNLVSTPCYINCTLQYILSTQTVVAPNAVGGNPQRNQVMHQEMFSVGANQNSNHKFAFKIPKGFQRVREGMKWQLVWSTNASINRQHQVIYKVQV